MSLEFNAEYTKLLARLNEKADQYSEEADRIHDDIHNLVGQVRECGQQVISVRQAAALIEGRIVAALEVDKKISELTNSAAESARQSAFGATQDALLKMLKNISAVTAQAESACVKAERRMLLSNAWVIACIISAIVGVGAGGAFLHYINKERFLTIEQVEQAGRGRQFDSLWRRATPRERQDMQKIARRPEPRN